MFNKIGIIKKSQRKIEYELTNKKYVIYYKYYKTIIMVNL